MKNTARAVIVANGALPPGDLRSVLKDSFVLAADGGGNRLTAQGLLPDAVLGDFDSLVVDLPHSVERIAAPDQNYTDLDKALNYLERQGFREVVMTAVTGDRLDHTFGALSMLIKYGRRLDLTLLDTMGEARLVPGQIHLTTQPQQTVSLLAIGTASGITTQGLHWNLTDEQIIAGARDGISNVAVGDSVTIRVASGDLIVYMHHLL